MRGALLVAATIVAVLGSEAPARFAAAMPMSPPFAAIGGAGSAHLVANVCGRSGCAPVQTKKVVHTKPGSVAAKHI